MLEGDSCCRTWLRLLQLLLLPSAQALLLCWHSLAWETQVCPLQEVSGLLWAHTHTPHLLLLQRLLLPACVLGCVGVPCWAPGVQDYCCCPGVGQP